MGNTKSDLVASLNDEHDNVRAKAAEGLGRLKDPSTVPSLVQALNDPSTAVKEKAAEALGLIGRPEAQKPLEKALGVKNEDEWVSLQEATALGRCGGPRGIAELLRLSQDGDAKVVRTQALKAALALTGRPDIKDPDGPEAKAALSEFLLWWKENGSRVRWDAATGKFMVPH
jgi:HEAT repeat protein